MCQQCDEKSNVFLMQCPSCRTRLALNEPCKYARKLVVQEIEKRYGEVEGWKAEPNCGCGSICKRKARLKNAEQTDYGRTKIFGNR